MIDAVGDVGVEIAERIVRQRGEVDDGVDSVQIAGQNVTHVLADMRHVGDAAAGGEGACS